MTRATPFAVLVGLSALIAFAPDVFAWLVCAGFALAIVGAVVGLIGEG